MRLWMIGIFCIAAVQIHAPAAGANKTYNTGGAAVETATTGVVNNTVAAAVESATAAAVNNTGVAAGNNTVKVAAKNTGGAAGKKLHVAAGNKTSASPGIKLHVGDVKKTVKVAVGNKTATAGNHTRAAVNTAAAFGNVYFGAGQGVHERSFRRARSAGNEPLNAAFADKIRNWLRRLKNRLFGKKKNEATTPTPDDQSAPVVTLDKEDLVLIRRNPKGLRVNLTTLTFDPKRDWGFRLGKWLIIRKVSPWKKPDERSKGPQKAIPADDGFSESPATGPPILTTPPQSKKFEPVTPNPSAAPATGPPMVTTAPQSTKSEDASPIPEAPAEGTTRRIDTAEKKRDHSVEVIGPKD